MKFLIALVLTLTCLQAHAVNYLHVSGANADVDTGSEDIYSAGGDATFPAAAAATTILSSSANDTAAGTGARTVKVTGLNSTFMEVSETVTMNGTSTVATTYTYLRVNSIEVLTAGSGATNAGVITAKHSSTVIQSMEVGAGRTRSAVFTVPTTGSGGNWRLKKYSLALINAGSTAVYVQVLTRKQGGVWQIRDSAAVYGVGMAQAVIELDLPLSAGEDIRLRATSSGDNASVVGSMDFQYGSSPNF